MSARSHHARGARIADLMDDVVIELTVRRQRTVLALVAVALSTGALIASVGISQTAATQISSDLAASTLDERPQRRCG